MVAVNLKAETLALIDQRAAMEASMDAIIADLCAPGGPGLSGGLVDPEGFPRGDIDVLTVRSQRGRLSELRNDYKDITTKIEQKLEVLHSAKLSKNAQMPSNVSAAFVHDGTSQESLMDVDMTVRIPFAMVDEITDYSPASEDGLQLGDLIIKFGNVEVGDEVLSRLASEVQSKQDNPVHLIIMRQGSLSNLTITPRRWHGRGLLGCHFRIL